MTPVRYAAQVLPDGHLPLPDGFPAKAGDTVQITVSSVQLISDETDPVLSLSGLGKEIWAGIDPDHYVRQLREGWE